MDSVQAFRLANALVSPAFQPSSRYHGLPTAELTLPDGRKAVYVTRRFLPSVANFSVLKSVTVVAGERLDNLAAAHLGDAEQWWRLCDANGAMLPEALVAQPGDSLDITMPEGVPGPSDAR